ncbi:EAL domain-containing protein [Caldimonas tepidiphila]|uniref:EAL domain-containing protein n=1 Tax=Caldimonas tepidiphila TaxID=2315841 RepID=UPI000E5C1673|nr:EAL domain-containing protein [Caldimonas tepidiphila]
MSPPASRLPAPPAPPGRALAGLRRQTLSFAALLGLMLLCGLLALSLQQGAGREARTGLDHEARELALALQLQGAASRMAAASRAYLLSWDSGYREQYEAARDEVQRTLSRQGPQDEESRRVADAAQAAFRQYAASADRIARYVEGALAEAEVRDPMWLWRTEIQPAQERFQQRLAEQAALHQDRFDAARERSARLDRAATWFGWSSLALLLASAALAIWTYRGLLHGSRESHRATREVLEALRRSEEQLRLTLEGVIDHAIVQLDREGRVASWNAGARHILGHEEAQVIGEPFDLFFAPAEREAGLPHRMLEAAARQGRHAEDCWQLRADGRRFRAGMSLSALHAGDGSVRGYVQVCHDISARFELEERLRAALAQNEFVQQAARIGVWRWNPETEEVWWSDSFKAQLGYMPHEIGSSFATFDALLHPDDREQAWNMAREVREHRRGGYENTFRLRRRDGSWQWTLTRGEWYAPPGAPGSAQLLGVHLDISALIEANQRLAAEREAALVTLHSIGEGLIVTDRQGRVEQLNQSACAMTGWSEDEARGRPVGEVLRLVDELSGRALPDPVGACLEPGGSGPGHAAHVARLLARDGREIPLETSVASIEIGGERRGAVLVFRDVSEARRLVRDMAWEASHDALTGLLNRREFDRRLARVLAQADRSAQHALLYFDLDRFKVVNDSCGHAAGDELLRQLARLVEGRLRERDSFARMGGDEFAVLLEHCSLPHARTVADNILAALRDWRFVCHGRAFQVAASIGVVPFTSQQHDAEELIRRADHAAYAAKQAGRNRAVVHGPGEALIEQRQRDSDILHRLDDALRVDRFELHAQPIVAVDASRQHQQGEHCEILLRLRDENGALMPPASFLPAAERYDLMPELDRRVVDKTLRALARMPRRLEQLKLCTINLSARTLGDAGYAAHVERLLRETGVPAAKICFEITETAAIADLPRAQAFVERLRWIGCRFALDDFGTGMASFAYLKQLPVDYIKIDGSFVTSLATSAIDLSMVRAINDISHEMGRQTIAEFVPDEATLEVLRRLGIDFAQGWGVGRPVRLEAEIETEAGA